MKHSKALPLVALLASAVLFLISCSTTPKADWDSRVGTFTYDQAIAELGPPDRQIRLADGKTVASWIKRRAGGGQSTMGASQPGGSGYDQILRLTFDAEVKLAAWSRNY